MEYYDFEVLQGDEIIAAEPAVALDNSRAAWPLIVRMARELYPPGCRIRVREQSGGTVILIGVAAARRFPISRFCGWAARVKLVHLASELRAALRRSSSVQATKAIRSARRAMSGQDVDLRNAAHPVARSQRLQSARL